MNGISINAKPFTKEFMDELRVIDDYRIKGYFSIIESVNREIDNVSKIITEKAIANEDARLLMTIPGISFYSALLIASEIGEPSLCIQTPSISP
jgi:transposase